MAYQAFADDPQGEWEEPDRTHLIVALDLLSGLTQAMGEKSRPFFANSEALTLMIACFKVRVAHSVVIYLF